MSRQASTLAVRLDSAGDVLLTGPAVRALANGSDRVLMLVGPNGVAAAELLPMVDEVLVWDCPWISPDPGAVQADDICRLRERLCAADIDRAVVFTSFHQSPLPTALVLRTAGVGFVSAISEDYPGSLLDVRHRVAGDPPEAERALSLARASGFELPTGDPGRLAVTPDLPPVDHLVPSRPYVVVHPGTSVPARAWHPERMAAACALLAERGHQVVVTGSSTESRLTDFVAGSRGRDLGGLTTLAELASVLAGASVVVVGNTGPAHLAAAVRTPVVSLFAPTVPAARWAPYGVPVALLGDQQAACRNTRATQCPVAGHPCLACVEPLDVLIAVEKLSGARQTSPALTAGESR